MGDSNTQRQSGLTPPYSVTHPVVIALHLSVIAVYSKITVVSVGSYYSWHKTPRWVVTPEGFLARLHAVCRKSNKDESLSAFYCIPWMLLLSREVLTQHPPFCPPEPSYETVSPLLCPPLENCSLSGDDCPYGFQQDKNGCLLCQCLSSKFAVSNLVWGPKGLRIRGAVHTFNMIHFSDMLLLAVLHWNVGHTTLNLCLFPHRCQTN